jgi:hypothetical protein
MKTSQLTCHLTLKERARLERIRENYAKAEAAVIWFGCGLVFGYFIW